MGLSGFKYEDKCRKFASKKCMRYLSLKTRSLHVDCIWTPRGISGGGPLGLLLQFEFIEAYLNNSSFLSLDTYQGHGVIC